MLDPKLMRNNPDSVRDALRKRKADVSLADKFLALDQAWRELTKKTEELKARQNSVSKEIAKLKSQKQDASGLLADMKNLSQEIKELDNAVADKQEELRQIALVMPNIPHFSVPKGISPRDNIEIRKWGKQPKFDFSPKAHYEIGANLGILDFESAAKLSGSRFVVLKGLGAALERALISFMLDMHTRQNKYLEVFPPVLVDSKCMTGTGQLPKFEEELYKCQDDLYLVPTAEVSVTNLHRDEILDSERLPIKYVAYSPCFRREAGSYGKDVKGIIRQHQFNKVELVKFAAPDKSYEELESLTNNAEDILKKLKLHYRVVELCAADLGFASTKTYDLEVWFPSEKGFREVSSCSNFEDFQARRANIRHRNSADDKPEYVHTLNGSGLAIGRILAAIIENYQKKDGSVEIPKVLQPYLHKLTAIK